MRIQHQTDHLINNSNVDLSHRADDETRWQNISTGPNGMNGFINELRRDWPVIRSLGYRMARRNLAATYRDSWIGFAWLFIQPFTTAILWILLREYQIIQVNVAIEQYIPFVLAGTLCWQAFCDGLLIPNRTINDNKSMLTKVHIPPEALLLGGLLESLVRIGASMMVTLVLLSMHRGTTPVFSDVALILGPGLALCFGFSAGLLLAPSSLLIPDVMRIILLCLPFFMYLTPVVFNIPQSGLFRTLMLANPLSYLLIGCRNLLIHHHWPNPITAVVLISIIFTVWLIAGYLLRRSLPHIIERMGS